MPITIEIENPEQEFVSMGNVTHESVALAMLAAFGRSQAQGIELRFERALGQRRDDPADDLAFRLLAGKGKGEVLKTRVNVVLRAPTTLEELGTLHLEGTSIRSYSEHDQGQAVAATMSMRASKITYRAAGGTGPVELDVLQNAQR